MIHHAELGGHEEVQANLSGFLYPLTIIQYANLKIAEYGSLFEDSNGRPYVLFGPICLVNHAQGSDFSFSDATPLINMAFDLTGSLFDISLTFVQCYGVEVLWEYTQQLQPGEDWDDEWDITMTGADGFMMTPR